MGNKTFIEDFIGTPEIKLNIGIILVKDHEHRFISVNQNFSELAGYKPSELVGLSDFDMRWSEQSNLYIQHEKNVMSGFTYTTLEPLNGTSNVQLITKKEAIYDKRNIISGTIAQAIPVTTNVEFSNLAGVEQSIIIKDYPHKLTLTEELILYYFIKGHPRKSFIELIGVQPHTYDFHIKNIKIKFGALTTTDLKNRCYLNNLHKIIPNRVLSRIL